MWPVAESWSLPQGRDGYLSADAQDESANGGGLESPCYGCGVAKSPHLCEEYVCDECGRLLCTACWSGGGHGVSDCPRIPAGTAEGQAAEWAAEIKAGRVTPDGVIATGGDTGPGR